MIQPIQPGQKARQIVGELQSAFGYIRRQKWTDPDAPSATAVHAAVTLGAAAQDVTSGITNPDFPRNVTVKGNASGIAGNVVITGTNIRDEAITETIALDAANEVQGNKAFKTVTNINFPAKTNGSGDTVSVGIGKKMGLDRKMVGDEHILATVDGVKETTAPTVAYSSSAIESNTLSPNTAPNASRDLVAVYVTTEKTHAKQTTA